MRIYLDNCCYNRPFDDKSQQRIHAEAKAILKIIFHSKSNNDEIIGSNIIQSEINKINNVVKKSNVDSLYKQSITENIDINKTMLTYTEEIMKNANIKQMDALHLTCAKFANVNVFLTVDDKLIKASHNLNLKMRVMNPVNLGV